MISIIVSSYKPLLFEAFSENVSKTVGLPYEIIQIENPGLMGICEAYNKGAKKAQYPYLCFCHEDILFRTENWGQKVISTFDEDSKIGLIGIAGSTYKPWAPSGFSFSQLNKVLRMSLIQVEPSRSYPVIFNPNNEIKTEVAAVDGCWFCTKKEIAEQFPFDEKLFSNFHCYDVDFSLQVGEKYKVIVIYELMLEHHSTGQFNTTWITDTIKLHKKWRKLPRSTEVLSAEEVFRQELGAFLFIMKKANLSKVGQFEILSVLFRPRMLKILGLKNWFRFQAIILAKVLKIPVNLN